ncbi:MAG: hypothetical protein HBSAPP03_05150 [Phycisphaerae bacterium]|nr:MAG: hypothetical protein HBSAPP03_05150 [Phycisphaerae bacterium]
MKQFIAGVVACTGLAGAAQAQLYSEYISGDLPDFPAAAPPVVVTTGGVTLAAVGFVTPMAPDVDFITVIVSFPTTQLLFDMDHLVSPLEDGVMGVGLPGQYPNPAWVNDDDFDVALDALCGHAAAPRDSLIDMGALLGNPAIIPAGAYTIAMGRTGEQFIGWNGSANMILKLEYQLYVYANPVPAPASAGMLGLGALAMLRRRRR